MKSPPAGLGNLDWLLLLKLKDRTLDALLTAGLAVLVLVSRFALLANGPWEWDETLFARGILHFELAAHFPHPPGFPGWLAIGHVLTPLTDDPLRALQIASAAFSVAALWVLAALGRRVASPPVAAAAAVLVLAAPGPWLYAVRGFSTTAATVLALGAGLVAIDGLRGRRVTVFSLLVTAAFLIRPILLPTLAVLWVGCVFRVRPLRRLIPGILGGTAAILVSVLFMARAEGGWGAFVEPFRAHGQRHFSRLVGNLGGYSELGLVKGLGGTLPATLLFLAAALGLVVWARKYGRRSVVVWALVLSVTVGQLVWLQNRTYGRYAAGAQMAIAPLLAAAASLVPPAAACAGLLGAATWLGATSLPLVREQHRTQLPGWRAVQAAREAAVSSGRTVVLEPELHPFASYLWHLYERRGEPNPPWVLSPWDPVQWEGIDGPWLVATVHRHLYPDPLRGIENYWGGVSTKLQPLTQQRFLEAWVIEDPPLPLNGWWPGEIDEEGRRFMWGGVEATMAVPPLVADSVVGIALRPAPGSEAVDIHWQGFPGRKVDGEGGEERLWFDVSPASAGKVTELRLSRARAFPPGGEDLRPLSTQFFDVRALESGAAWSGLVTQMWRRSALRVEIAGAYGVEDFGSSGEGVWLEPRAVISVPCTSGTLRFRFWAPRPTPSRTTLIVGERTAAGPVDLGQAPIDVLIAVFPDDVANGRVTIEVSSDAYRPDEHGHRDRRQLGVVLSSIAFEPDGAAS